MIPWIVRARISPYFSDHVVGTADHPGNPGEASHPLRQRGLLRPDMRQLRLGDGIPVKAVRLLRVSKRSHDARQSPEERPDSGAVVCVYGYRLVPFGRRAMVSRDGGPDGDLGYPASVELRDGSVFTIYYQKLRSAREKCSILWSRWKVPE